MVKAIFVSKAANWSGSSTDFSRAAFYYIGGSDRFSDYSLVFFRDGYFKEVK
jgi:hypothetical protein